MGQFAEILLPLSLPVNYTYGIPKHLREYIEPGMRVVVPLGKRKLYTGLVKEVHDREPKDIKVRDILDAEDESPIISAKQIQFWEWLAEYYLCNEGEVMNAALPGGLKLESEMVIQRNFAKEIIDEELNDAEFLIVEALEQQDRLGRQGHPVEIGGAAGQAQHLLPEGGTGEEAGGGKGDEAGHGRLRRVKRLTKHSFAMGEPEQRPCVIVAGRAMFRRCGGGQGTAPALSRMVRQAAGRRRSTISAHQLQPAGIASSLKLYFG